MYKKIPAFIVVEKWLEQSINPQIQSVGIMSKQATNFGSTGLELVLTPLLMKKFKPTEEKELTLAELEDVIVAKLIEHTHYKNFIHKFKTLEKPLSEEELKNFEKEYSNTTNYRCPTFEYKKYSDTQFLIVYSIFNLNYSMELFQSPEVIAKFLFYKAKMLESEILSQNVENYKTNKFLSEQYIWFLIDLIFKLAQFKE